MISLRNLCGCVMLAVTTAVLVVLFSGSATTPVLGSVATGTAGFTSNLTEREFDTAQDEDDFYYRRNHGHYDVVWMHGLVQDFRDELISEEDVLMEIEAVRPGLTVTLLAAIGSVNECFLHNVIAAQTDFEIGTDEPIPFDVEQYLDEHGEVIPGYERDYNTARRANLIMAAVIPAARNYCLGTSCQVVNNQCCKSGAPNYKCTTKTGYMCKIDGQGWCGQGCHNCP